MIVITMGVNLVSLGELIQFVLNVSFYHDDPEYDSEVRIEQTDAHDK